MTVSPQLSDAEIDQLSDADLLEMAREAGITPAFPLPSALLPWPEFLRANFPQHATAPLSPRHVSLWQWFDDLRPDAHLPPRVEIWPRGGAKSSTVELGTARVGSKLSRRFVLYVCGTQDQADSHVQNIAPLLLQLGADPSLNRFGRAQGWRRDQLRTANGFNVAGFGIDSAQRGIKIDQYRPDLIVFDDVDSRHDSIEAVRKKIEAITQSILPTCSRYCAYLFVQNLIHANSVAAQLVDNRADFLLDRDLPTVEPAVRDLKLETIERGNGMKPIYRVIGGTPTWEGQDLETVERQINAWGLDAFEREAQHDVRHGGEPFFHMYQGVDYGGKGIDGLHVCLPFDIPAHWTWFGGLDWGYDAPFAFVLCAVDGNDIVYAVDEIVQRRLVNTDQAQAVKKMLGVYAPPNTLIASDPSMWAKKVKSDGIGEADIESFHREGLRCAEANNNRQHGWDQIRTRLGSRKLVIFKGRCPILENQLKTAVHDRNRTEDLDDDADIPPSHMDVLQALRYALMTRPRPAIDPSAPKPVQEYDWTPGASNHTKEPVRRL